MFDLIPSEVKEIRTGSYELKHKDIANTSLFSDFGGVSRVPLEALVPFKEEPVIVEPVRVKGYDALMNTKTGAVLDTRPVSKTYNLVSHDRLFNRHAELMDGGELPLNNIDVVDRLFDDGVRAHRTVYFNDLESGIGDGSDLVRCRMDIFNSIDMSWAFQVFSGAYRDLCRNTLVFGGQKSYQQRAKHTANLSPDAMISKAGNSLDMWTSQRELMEKWTKAKLTREQFGQILAQTVCYKNTAATRAEQGNPVNERLMNYLLYRFEEEIPELGQTFWAAFNALTHWSTHTNETWTGDDGIERATGRKTQRKEVTQRVRGEQVRNVTESPSWKYLEGLAA